MVVSLEGFANATAPNIYPVRLYPDITHSIDDQLPVPNWDPAFQWTENRETVNPRPALNQKELSHRHSFLSWTLMIGCHGPSVMGVEGITTISGGPLGARCLCRVC